MALSGQFLAHFPLPKNGCFFVNASNNLMAVLRKLNRGNLNRNLHTTAYVCRGSHCPQRVELKHKSEDTEGSSDKEFTKLQLFGFNDDSFEQSQRRRKAVPPKMRASRAKTMKVDQDWTSEWPAAATFKASVVPFPVRQGRVVKQENDGIPPEKYANMELMKIPNFLHLTPPHVKKHCAAIKKFCTPWPEGLETDEACTEHFPLEVITQDYVTDSISVHDPRARPVSMKVRLDDLDLDYHARDKLLRLVGEKFDPHTGVLTLTMDRCPTKKQNYDYGIYLLTVLFKESWKTEPWESEKTVADMEKYVWDINPSKAAIVHTVAKMQETTTESPAPAYVKGLSSDSPPESLAQAEPVQEYARAVEELHNHGEDLHTLNKYKDTVKNLLLNTQQGSGPLTS